MGNAPGSEHLLSCSSLTPASSRPATALIIARQKRRNSKAIYTMDATNVRDNAKSPWEELRNLSHESLPPSPIGESGLYHTATTWNPHADGSSNDIRGSDVTLMPSSSHVALERHEQPSSSRSQTITTEWDLYANSGLHQIWASDEPHAMERPSSSRSCSTIRKPFDSHHAEPEDPQGELRPRTPETASSSSFSVLVEPRLFMSDSVPQHVEPARLVADRPTTPKSLGDTSNRRVRSTRSLGNLMKMLQVGSASHDVPTPPSMAESKVLGASRKESKAFGVSLKASKVFGVSLEESMHHASVEVSVLDNWLVSHGVSRTVQGQVPVVVGQCLKFLRAKGLHYPMAAFGR